MNKRRPTIPMIRPITQYIAPDGEVFPTDQQAQRHAQELLLHRLEGFVNHAFPNVGHRPSVIRAVELLSEDLSSTTVMLRELLRVLTYGEADTEA